MRTIDLVDALEAPDEFMGSSVVEETKIVTVFWKQASKHKRNAAYVEKLREEDILLEVPKSAEITFTALMLGPEVRD